MSGRRSHHVRTTLPLALLAYALLPMPPAGSSEHEQHAPASEEPDDLGGRVTEVEILEALFPTFALCHWSRDPPVLEFIYGDTDGVIHHMTSKGDGRLHENWRSHPLEGTIREVFVRDLDRNGKLDFVTYTNEPNIYVWERGTYDLLWEARATDEQFGFIQTMVIANVDADESLELVLAVDGKIEYYDATEFFLEKEGRDFVDPSFMLIADVDADGEDEIITNDGFVIDVRTLVIEWQTTGFGYPMRLFDIDNDGIPELVGETRGALTFWDIDERREIWAAPR